MSAEREKPMAEADVKAWLQANLPHWKLEDGWIRRTYKTAGWKGTLMVINTVGHLAEAAWHHPDITASYAWVEVRLMTQPPRASPRRTSNSPRRSRKSCTGSPARKARALEGTPHGDHAVRLHQVRLSGPRHMSRAVERAEAKRRPAAARSMPLLALGSNIGDRVRKYRGSDPPC